MLSLEKAQDLTEAFPHLREAEKKVGQGLLAKAYSDRTRMDAFNLEEGMFRLDFRKKLFAVSVVRQWIMLPGVGASLSLEIFKTRVDVVMSNLV